MLLVLKKWLELLKSRINQYASGRISTKQKIMYAKRISFLLGAHMPLSKILRLFAQESKNNKELFNKLLTGINGGIALSAIPEHQIVFGKIATVLIELGEESGTLQTSFELIAQELEKSSDLKQKIFSALLYPSIIILGTGTLLLLLIVAVFPRLVSVFSGLRVELPLMTRIVIQFSLFLQSWWWVVLLILICSCIGFKIWYQQKIIVRIFTQKVLLKIPILSKIIRAYYCAHITRITGLLLSHGSGLITSLNLVQNNLTHDLYHDALEQCSVACVQGGSLATVLAEYPELFDTDFIQIISSGEESGSLSESFLYSSNLYSRELESVTKTLTTSIEPILMITIGIIVAGIALSIITPMYQITEHLKIK